MSSMKSTCLMIPVYGESDELIQCINSVILYTPPDVKIYICDDASPDRPTEEFLKSKGLLTSNIIFHRREFNLGFLGNCNEFFKYVSDTNVILVNSDVTVSVGWFQAMMQPLTTRTNVATVTAMTNSGSIASVVLGKEALPELTENQLFELNERITLNEQPENARIPVGVGHCILITSEALEIVGYFDTIFNPGYGEEVDFCIRATKYGFVNYLANTVVLHAGSVTFGKKSIQLRENHDLLLNKKHPGYLDLIKNFTPEQSPVESMFLNVFTKLRGLRVLIDARMMNPEFTGTSRLIFNTILNLQSFKNTEVSVLVHSTHLEFWRTQFALEINLVETSTIANEGLVFDIAYSPTQISFEETMQELKFWGRRVVVLQLDLIAFYNWQYFPTIGAYTTYQNAIKTTFREADSVLYISKYIKELAQSQFTRNRPLDDVVFCGVDHFQQELNPVPSTYSILVLGAGFAHKNLNYAFELVKSVRTTLPDVKLVFVGPKPTFGSDEDFYKNSDVKQNEWVNIHSWLSDQELLEQIRKTSVVLYPSLSEGFGFIPFEAAKLGKASLFSKTTSIAEFFSDSPAFLTFSLDADRTTLLSLLTDADLYEKQVKYVNSVGEEYSWARVTEKLDNVFRGLILRERYVQSGSVGNSISIGTLFDFFRYLGTRKAALMLFPPFSKRRNIGIQILRKIFL